MEDEESRMSGEADSSSNSEDPEYLALSKRAEELEATIGENVYLYDAHVELVSLYKQMIELPSLRQAYGRFHKVFPLTKELWLNWLKVEIDLATSQEEKKHVLSLFELATQDYLSVPLWLEYAQFALSACELDETREILERGLNVAGLHVVESSLLWDSLRELEMARLSMHEPNTEEYKKQLQRVVQAFKRQLSVPLFDMEDIYLEWREFVSLHPGEEIDAKPIEWGYKKATEKLAKCKVFEERLLEAEDEQSSLTVYMDYIKAFRGDPTFMLCLYERAVEKSCLIPEIWINYLFDTYMLGDVAVAVSKRAVRNVTWNAQLWVFRLRILEKNGFGKEDMLNCFEEGVVLVQSAADLWLAYLEYIRRNHPEELNKLFDKVEERLTSEFDPNQRIRRFHASIAASNNDLDTAMQKWKKIFYDANMKKSQEVWLEHINFLKQHQPSQLNTTFVKAIKSCSDQWPQSIVDEWLTYERLHGSVDDVLKCSQKLNEMISTQAKIIPKINEVPEVNEMRKRKHSNSALIPSEPKKNKWEESKEVLAKNQKMPANLDPTKSVFISNLSMHVTQEQLTRVFPNSKVTLCTNNKGESRCFAYVQFETMSDAEEALKRDREPVRKRPMFVSKCKVNNEDNKETVFKYSTGIEDNKLFVRGLPIKFQQANVEDIFKPYGAVSVRLVLQKSGQPKGLAYVDFATGEEAEKAMKATNQTEVSGHVITVAISAPPRKPNREPIARQESVRSAPARRLNAFVPRCVQQQATTIVNDQPAAVTKSNDDFRKMFLGQK